MMKILMASALLMLPAAYALADSPFDGTWTAEVVRPAPAPKQDLTITLSTDDKGKVTGKIAIAGGPTSDIDWGFVKGDLITFRVMLPFGKATVEFVHVGRVDGNKLMLGRRPEDLTQGRLVEFVASKS
jgi:hypothetical protein